MAGDIIINNLLCFISSAKNDHNKAILVEIANSFYSIEKIKEAKVEITNLLKKDFSTRRGPGEKLKHLNDVIDLYEECDVSKMKIKFVADSYKQLPPMGMELLAPIIINLANEVTKINEILPKILDIKTEVLNTADTVREMAVNVKKVNDNFNTAVLGLQAASNDLTGNNDNGLQRLEDIESFRLSTGGDTNNSKSTDNQDNVIIAATPNERDRVEEGAVGYSNPFVNELIKMGRRGDSSTGAIPKQRPGDSNLDHDDDSENNENDDGQRRPWNLVVSAGKKKKERHLQHQRPEQPASSPGRDRPQPPYQRSTNGSRAPGGPPQHKQIKSSGVRLTGTRKESQTL